MTKTEKEKVDNSEEIEEATKVEKNLTPAEKLKAYDEEIVTYTFPYIEGKDEAAQSLSIIVNGIETKITRGEEVQVPRNVIKAFNDMQKQDKTFQRFKEAQKRKVEKLNKLI